MIFSVFYHVYFIIKLTGQQYLFYYFIVFFQQQILKEYMIALFREPLDKTRQIRYNYIYTFNQMNLICRDKEIIMDKTD